MIAPPWFPVPPNGYGGVEALLADLVDGLTDRGHQVFLAAPAGSVTPAVQLGSWPVFPPEQLGTALPEAIHAARATAVFTGVDVDLVHDHSLAGPLLAHGRTVPTVVTTHGPTTGGNGEYYRALSGVRLVAISESQRVLAPDLAWLATVPNAIRVDSFPFRADKADYLLWMGRFCSDKGPHVAIDVAIAAGLPIVLAGKCVEPSERAYFAEYIEPRLGPQVQIHGIADRDRKRELLANARALLFPIRWDEPFGLVMIEALACGTPVVAFDRGAAPDVVVDGVTGFVCHTAEEMVAAIGRLGEIDPARCRARAERAFDVAVMVDGYESAYRAALAETVPVPVRRTRPVRRLGRTLVRARPGRSGPAGDWAAPAGETAG